LRCRISQTGTLTYGYYLHDGDENISFTLREIRETNIFAHPEYDCINLFNDISVIMVDQMVEFTRKKHYLAHKKLAQFVFVFPAKIQPIPLPVKDLQTTTYDGKKVTYIGLGIYINPGKFMVHIQITTCKIWPIVILLFH